MYALPPLPAASRAVMSPAICFQGKKTQTPKKESPAEAVCRYTQQLIPPFHHALCKGNPADQQVAVRLVAEHILSDETVLAAHPQMRTCAQLLQIATDTQPEKLERTTQLLDPFAPGQGLRRSDSEFVNQVFTLPLANALGGGYLEAFFIHAAKAERLDSPVVKSLVRNMATMNRRIDETVGTKTDEALATGRAYSLMAMLLAMSKFYLGYASRNQDQAPAARLPAVVRGIAAGLTAHGYPAVVI